MPVAGCAPQVSGSHWTLKTDCCFHANMHDLVIVMQILYRSWFNKWAFGGSANAFMSLQTTLCGKYPLKQYILKILGCFNTFMGHIWINPIAGLKFHYKHYLTQQKTKPAFCIICYYINTVIEPSVRTVWFFNHCKLKNRENIKKQCLS